MSTTWDIGDAVPLTWVITVGGVATDATVALTVTAPDGTSSTPSVAHGSTGNYSASVAPTSAGTYLARWVASGAVTAAEDLTFYVNPNLTARDYCSLPELKSSLGIPNADTDSDDALERAIRSASRAVDKYCGRRFWQDTTAQTRTFETCSATYAYVDDISTLAGLVVATDDNDDGTPETTWTVVTDFAVTPRNNLADGRPVYRLDVVGNRYFPIGRRRANVHVTARFGWPSVPEEVRDATILKAAKLFARKDSPAGVAGSSEFGVVRISRFEDPDVVMLLADFRRGVPGIG